MWIDTMEVRSKHNVISEILACLQKIPLYNLTTFWGDDVANATRNTISTIVFVDFEKSFNFLERLPAKYRREECFFVLVANETLNETSTSRTVMSNILELSGMGHLNILYIDRQKKKNTNVPVAIIIEIFRLSSRHKKMYVMSRRKQIKTAKFCLKELFNIEIEADHDPTLKHEPSINTCRFICHQTLDFTSKYFRNMFALEIYNLQNFFPLKCSFIDRDNVKLTERELEEITKNNLTIICGNPPQSTQNSIRVWSNCIDIEVPVVDDCADIFLILIMTILNSSLPVTVPFIIRSEDRIFLAAKNYLAKNSSRKMWLPDIDDNNLIRIYFLILCLVFLCKTFIKLNPNHRMTIVLRKTIPKLCNELNNLLKCFLCFPFWPTM